MLAGALAREGTKVVFTLCGGHILPIYDGCLDEGIRVIDVRHEQSAAFAADAWARVTGEVGVAVVTAGPGVCNSVTAVANARNSDSPVVIVGGQGETGHADRGSLQETPHLRILESITKWARSCRETSRVPEFAANAFRAAGTPRTGPAFLEVPWDVLYEEAEEKSVDWKGAGRPRVSARADPEGVSRAVELLAAAERPVVIAGTSLRWSVAPDAILALADAFPAPVYLNSLARGALPPDHSSFFHLSRRRAFEDADVVLNLGAPFDFRLGYGRHPSLSRDAQVVMADVQADTIGHNRAVDVGLVGDVGLVAGQLAESLAALDISPRTSWLEKLRAVEAERRAKFDAGVSSDNRPVHALRLAREVAQFADEDTIVIGDGGNIVATGAKIIPARRMGNWLDPGRFGCLGVGLPFALAAKLARPDHRVLTLLGDGAFGITAMELDTLVRHRVPVVAVIGNDGAWSQIRGPQLGLYGKPRAVATLLDTGARYDEMARALGCHGELVEAPDDVAPAIDRAFASGKPAVVNVLVDPSSNLGTGSAAM